MRAAERFSRGEALRASRVALVKPCIPCHTSRGSLPSRSSRSGLSKRVLLVSRHRPTDKCRFKVRLGSFAAFSAATARIWKRHSRRCARSLTSLRRQIQLGRLVVRPLVDSVLIDDLKRRNVTSLTRDQRHDDSGNDRLRTLRNELGAPRSTETADPTREAGNHTSATCAPRTDPRARPTGRDTTTVCDREAILPRVHDRRRVVDRHPCCYQRSGEPNARNVSYLVAEVLLRYQRA